MHDSHNKEDEYYDDDVPLVFTGPIVDDPCREIFGKIDSKKANIFQSQYMILSFLYLLVLALKIW